MSDKKQMFSDEDLMELYKTGDYEAFEILYLRHSGRIYGYLQKKVNVQSAQELLQEVFLKVHRSCHQYLPEYPFLPWLFTIARNSVFDFLRLNETNLAARALSEVSDQLVAGAGEIQGNENSDLVLALKTLPDTQKRAIELRYLSDWSFEKIAQELDTSAENSRQLVSRGIKKIRTGLLGGRK